MPELALVTVTALLVLFAAVAATTAEASPLARSSSLPSAKKPHNTKVDAADARNFSAAEAALNTETFTISGISAGGAMAVQYQYAFSSTIKGVGVTAGVPYMCAAGVTVGAFACMDDPFLIVPSALLTLAATAANLGNIDNLRHIPSHTMLLFSGQKDTVVNPGTMRKLEEMQKTAGVHNMTSVFTYPAEHSWVTNFWGKNCSHLGTPFVNNCDYDFAGHFFRQSFQWLALPFQNAPGVYNPNNMKSFDQTKFGASPLLNSLAKTGYYYVPEQCQSSSTQRTNAKRKCHLHLNFHGCEQSHANVGDTYISHTGLNEWAEANDIVILYPQVVPNDVLVNPKACFDWWGYAGETYALKWGPQMSTISRIVDELLEKGSL